MSKTLDQMRVEFQYWLDTDRKLHEPSIFRNDEAWMAWQHQQAKIDALDGKTVLPAEVVEAIEAGDTLCVENGMDGGHAVGVAVAAMVTGGEGVSADTPAAAIDSLAEEIRSGKT